MSPWLQLRRAAELSATPWRNGHGLTVPLFAGGPAHAPHWRLSVATITAAAPYSDFSDYRRAQVLLQGGPLTLWSEVQQLARLEAPGQRVEFDGGLPVRAEVEQSCSVFNTAILPAFGQLHSWLRPVLGSLLLPIRPGVLWMGQVLGGQMRLRCGDERHILHQGDAFAVNEQALPHAVLDGGGSLALAQLLRTEHAPREPD